MLYVFGGLLAVRKWDARIEWDLAVYCWLYVIMWAFIQDAAKVVTYKMLQSFGWVESVKVIDEKALKRGGGSLGVINKRTNGRMQAKIHL